MAQRHKINILFGWKEEGQGTSRDNHVVRDAVFFFSFYHEQWKVSGEGYDQNCTEKAKYHNDMKDELETRREGIKDNNSSQLRYNLFFAQTIIY